MVILLTMRYYKRYLKKETWEAYWEHVLSQFKISLLKQPQAKLVYMQLVLPLRQTIHKDDFK